MRAAMTLHYRDASDRGVIDIGPLAASGPYSLVGKPAALLRAEHSEKSSYARYGKRTMDIVLASVALFLSAPVLILLAIAMWIEGGNPFYTQERLGRNGRRFRMYKLRTMVIDAESRLSQCLSDNSALRAEWDSTQKLKRDPRITPIGRLLRKTSMDELPQIFNVLKGDMSIVGPRPMLPEQLPLYEAPDAYLGLRPGITGLWQVTARNEHSFSLRAVLDQRYASKVTLKSDIKIIGATFGVLLRTTGY
jgi:exopolysaccharide production protein ExoY